MNNVALLRILGILCALFAAACLLAHADIGLDVGQLIGLGIVGLAAEVAPIP